MWSAGVIPIIALNPRARVAARGRQSWTSPRQPSVFLSPPLDHFLPLLLAYSRFPSEVLAMLMTGFISITEARCVFVCYNRHTRSDTRDISRVTSNSQGCRQARKIFIPRNGIFLHTETYLTHSFQTESLNVKKYNL